MLTWFRSKGSQGRSEEPAQAVKQGCPGIARVLDSVFGMGKQPEVLDLGQLSGSSAVYLADRGARVCVEKFEPPKAGGPPEADSEPLEMPPVKISQPDAKFDLVLAWEYGDFVPPDRLEEFMSELKRVMAPGGWVVLFSKDRTSSKEDAHPDRPSSYRLEGHDRMVCLPSGGPARPRWAYANRVIEKALAPLSVQGIHLHVNRLREVVARKPPLRPAMGNSRTAS